MRKIRSIRKIISIILCGLLLLLPFFSAEIAFASEDIVTIAEQYGYEVDENNRPKAGIVIDAQSGQILWEENIDTAHSPASLTKMMTVYLALEAMEQGAFTLDTVVTASETDQAIGQIYTLSNNNIVAGVDYTIRELLTMVVVPSSNVATLMLANQVTTDQAAFVQKMNEKAAELGMTKTVFYNCSGAETDSFEGYYAPEGIDSSADNQSTARDLAIMTYHLINHYPQILEFTSLASVTVKEGTAYEETFENYNYSLPGAYYGYEGVNGLKTGSSPTAGFNYIATATRGDLQVIEVILGVGDWEDQDGEYYRHPFGNALLDYVFDNYEYKQVLAPGEYTISEQHIATTEDFYGVVPVNVEPSFSISDNQLVLENGLSSVSADLTASIDYQLMDTTTTETAASQSTTTSVEDTTVTKEKTWPFFEYGISAIVIVIGILLMIVSKLSQDTLRGRRHRSQGDSRFFLFLGILTILFGITLAFATWSFGGWLEFLKQMLEIM